MNKLLAVHAHFGKSALLAIVLSLWSANLTRAEEDTWLKRSRDILEHAPGSNPPSWLRTEPTQEALAAAKAVASLSEAAGTGERPTIETPGRVLIFASLSIPAPTLRALLDEASAPNVVLILRGVPAGANLQQTIMRLRALRPSDAAVPNVMLDPTAFLRFNVTTAPTFALIRGGREPPVIAEGAITVSWLRRVAANVAQGAEHLGRRAESYEIAEPDFVLEMQARLAKIDWAAQREAAMRGYWAKHHEFVRLPDTRKSREYLVDPSVELTQDLEDAQGNRLMQAGQRFNPLDWVVLSKTLIVFRGTDPRQVHIAAQAARRAQSQGHGVILLTTEIDAPRGWDHLSELERTLSGTVYLLPNTLAQQFHLESVPATIASQGKRLLVTEIPVGESP